MPAGSPVPARPAHRPSAREAMLGAAEAHLGAGGTLTLDSAARAAGVTKPGLMYHFATKEELLAAVVEHVAARCERQILARIAAREGGAARDLTAVPARERFLAYLDWSATADLSPAELAIFADPSLRDSMTRRWQEQSERWLDVPAGTPTAQRRRLLAVRLMADGLWFDRASGLLETSDQENAALTELAEEMLGEES
ncbi:TetR/AcrR family transcriptional regulator [Brachybacterium sp. YJGR34]|uniref:TetR/AcrR family transcriptional regulator n=1 Tax=Brachybacterium sp. YJGR34 TaxID=2059911 RepID=UPI001E5E6375|nr:TetR/AcrR family transcriptional regulator [Brachybacterium sp. YJGR34]